MQTFHSNHSYHPFNPLLPMGLQYPPLNSHPLDSSLLTKRGYQSLENQYHEDIYKKLKTNSSSALPNTRPLPAQNHPMSQMLQMQNFQMMMKSFQDQQDSYSHPFNPFSAPNPSIFAYKAREIFPKEELVTKKEEVTEIPPSVAFAKSLPAIQTYFMNWGKEFDFPRKDSSPTECSSEALKEESEDGRSSVQVEEPVLVGLTKMFPDWDLATICDFLVSGQPKESFEKEKLFRTERKRRRREKRKQLKQAKGESKKKN